ncbi:O-methyltransferase [Streptomyces sp. PsTaAH-137]|uniref:methyltransferase n=2 Tax=unclassified Streptomyces TaxID=2593676 RepID=UPI000DB952EB|nr:methyltransferase [Streptomyces sp. SID8367]MYT72918.1 methyltransferase [Streptomyces sp. SID8367]RAJ78894.1 O-methyltransferase [Streptomyces sp. PsTaAH-137]
MVTTMAGETSRLRATVDFVREQDTATLLPLLLPGLDGPELRSLADRCRFAHAALLLFPRDEQDLYTTLTECGLDPDGPPRPSVVVRERLAVRHRLDPADLDVGILRPAVTGLDGAHRTVEVFALTVPPGSGLESLVAHERERQHEAHLAFEVEGPDPLVLRGLCATLARHGAVPDGGGYNPHENGTVFYFTAPEGAKTAYRRMELYAPGDHRDILTAHLAEHRERQPAEALLRLLTGAWTTQALTAFAQLRVADALDTRRGTAVDDLAERIGASPRPLATLLRYLETLGAVAAVPGIADGYRLTPLGALLRTEAPESMRPLALLYGGPFYRSFGALAHTVRTGEPGFEHLFGAHHFDHFAADPELADLFDRSMAAGAAMFGPLPTHPVLLAAGRAETPARVVDIAGGNGALLGRILAVHRRLHGVLLERPHVVEAARDALESAGFGDRCTYRSGDFADVPADGDVYLLSRILHDWDDDRCLDILRHVARAMPDHADLLVVERVLPADGSASLATAWDLHMMCNVGGRERRADHYARLFADAGLTLVGQERLPLDGSVLHVRKAATAG